MQNIIDGDWWGAWIRRRVSAGPGAAPRPCGSSNQDPGATPGGGEAGGRGHAGVSGHSPIQHSGRVPSAASEILE